MSKESDRWYTWGGKGSWTSEATDDALEEWQGKRKYAQVLGGARNRKIDK